MNEQTEQTEQTEQARRTQSTQSTQRTERTELVERVNEQDEVLEVVSRAEAIRHKWLHRIATVVCRDPAGRILVHRRPSDATLFPGRFNWMLGGAVGVGESYGSAAARELAEEIGVEARPRFVLKFRCEGAISPYWLALHEVVLDAPIRPHPTEVAWHTWLPEDEVHALSRHEHFVPDAREALTRYRSESRGRGGSGD
ncbi:NUDIX domain-containing protein [Streptomyces sp. NPDC004610]|uniref:NUDIX hydrolase n=1 Tax=unclassified Streptomyces TaxID=2593676 RepID=UPI0033BF943E